MTDRMKKDHLIMGIALALLGGGLLFGQLRPDLIRIWFGQDFSWLGLIAGAGVFLLLFAAFRRRWALTLVAASVCAGASLLLLQDSASSQPNPVFLWPLCPALIGLALLLAGIFIPSNPVIRRTGAFLLPLSILTILAFYAMTAANLNMNLAWAALLLLAGAYLLTRAFSPQG